MNDSNKSDTSPIELGPSAAELGVQARRRLLRAGLSAAPAGLMLYGRSALATGTGHMCVRPSSFASLAPGGTVNTSASRAPVDDSTCLSHGYWKNNGDSTFKSNTKFLGSGTGTCGSYGGGGFTANPGSVYTNKSLQWVLNQTGNTNNAALARHLVGCWLTAHVYGNSASSLTKAQCYACWNGLNGGGSWTPVSGGPSWDLAMTMAYFTYLFGSYY